MKQTVLCNSETCPFKKNCYRSVTITIPKYNQSYANLEEFEDFNFSKCANFLCYQVYSKLNIKGE